MRRINRKCVRIDILALLALQGVFLVGNLLFSMSSGTRLAPMLLARTGSNAWIFGASQSIGGVAMVVGGLIIGLSQGLVAASKVAVVRNAAEIMPYVVLLIVLIIRPEGWVQNETD